MEGRRGEWKGAANVRGLRLRIIRHNTAFVSTDSTPSPAARSRATLSHHRISIKRVRLNLFWDKVDSATLESRRLDVFHNYFEFNNTFHCHQTRSTNNIHIISSKHYFGKRTLCNKTACMWNDLPIKFNCLKSTNLFKKRN